MILCLCSSNLYFRLFCDRDSNPADNYVLNCPYNTLRTVKKLLWLHNASKVVAIIAALKVKNLVAYTIEL